MGGSSFKRGWKWFSLIGLLALLTLLNISNETKLVKHVGVPKKSTTENDANANQKSRQLQNSSNVTQSSNGLAEMLKPLFDFNSSIRNESNSICIDVTRGTPLFVFVPDYFTKHGIGSQINNYVLAIHVAATLGRKLVVLPPQTDCKSRAGLYSLFQLPVPCSNVSLSALCPRRPRHRRAWKSSVYSATDDSFLEQPCWSNETVVIDGGFKLRDHYTQLIMPAERLTAIDWVSVARHLLPSTSEGVHRDDFNTSKILGWFEHDSLYKNSTDSDLFRARLYMGLAALVAPRLLWKRQVNGDRVHIPRYCAMHVRRGDKLVRDATENVKLYWSMQPETINRTNYIPLRAYVEKLVPHVDPQDVYIATDDPDMITSELSELDESHKKYWKFHVLKHRMHGHISQHRKECETLDEMLNDVAADLQVLQHAHVVVGEINSNWGRISQILRTSFDSNGTLTRRDFRVVIGRTKSKYLGV